MVMMPNSNRVVSAGGLDYCRQDFAHSPLVAFYEVTRACNLMCRHCRAEAQPHRHPQELDAAASLELLDQLKTFPKPPLVVLTGGDPMKRPDIFDIVRHGVKIGLKMAMTPSATRLVTDQAVHRLKDAGLHRLAVSLDAADAGGHDSFRGVPGSFARTLEIMTNARQAGLSMQVNTTITRHNVDQFDAMADVLDGYDIALWSVFFLVPTGRAQLDQRIRPEQYEQLFEKLFNHSRKHRYAVKTTEAPHYRRFMLEKIHEAGKSGENNSATGSPPAPAAAPGPAIVGTNDGKGVMFISHIGEIFPTGFLPIECGRFPAASPVEVYQQSPLFKDLRDPDKLQGKCGWCQYRDICGGSRARAYGVTGNPLAAEPDCVYHSPLQPGRAILRSVRLCLA